MYRHRLLQFRLAFAVYVGIVVSVRVSVGVNCYRYACNRVVAAVNFIVELTSLAAAAHMTVALASWCTRRARRVYVAYNVVRHIFTRFPFQP